MVWNGIKLWNTIDGDYPKVEYPCERDMSSL